MTTSEIGKITGYHAHVYYGVETRDKAVKIRDMLDAKFRNLASNISLIFTALSRVSTP